MCAALRDSVAKQAVRRMCHKTAGGPAPAPPLLPPSCPPVGSLRGTPPTGPVQAKQPLPAAALLGCHFPACLAPPPTCRPAYSQLWASGQGTQTSPADVPWPHRVRGWRPRGSVEQQLN